MHDEYRQGFERCTAMATAAVELTMDQMMEDPNALHALKVFMSYLYSGHCYHIPEKWSDSGLAIVMGLMRLSGWSGMYYHFDSKRVYDKEEVS